MIKVASIIGARPQFIKAVSISRAIKDFNKKSISVRRRIKEVVIHTGQHYDYNMNDIFFKELALEKPDYNLRIGSYSQGKQVALMLERIEGVFRKEAPDLVLVYGDTNSTLAGALAAAKLNIPVAHIEAGLRSFNKNMPEEINRILTDHISKFLFCPTETAVKNLTNEGIREGVFKVGDVMFDALLHYLNTAERKSNILNNLSLVPKSYNLVTIHRQENTDNLKQLKSILQSLDRLAREGNVIIFPIHPRTKKAINQLKFKGYSNCLKIISPISYLDMIVLEKNAKIILTDSGGVQKEAFFFGIPCLILREETEWLETVQDGNNILVGTDSKRIEQTFRQLSESNLMFSRRFSDGGAAKRAVKTLSHLIQDR